MENYKWYNVKILIFFFFLVEKLLFNRQLLLLLLLILFYLSLLSKSEFFNRQLLFFRKYLFDVFRYLKINGTDCMSEGTRVWVCSEWCMLPTVCSWLKWQPVYKVCRPTVTQTFRKQKQTLWQNGREGALPSADYWS